MLQETIPALMVYMVYIGFMHNFERSFQYYHNDTSIFIAFIIHWLTRILFDVFAYFAILIDVIKFCIQSVWADINKYCQNRFLHRIIWHDRCALLSNVKLNNIKLSKSYFIVNWFIFSISNACLPLYPTPFSVFGISTQHVNMNMVMAMVMQFV